MAKRKSASKPRKQNKKLQSQAFLIPPRVVTALTLLVMASLLYVWLSNSREALGGEITRLERELQNKVNARLDEEYRWSQLTHAVKLEEKLAEFNLTMTWPDSSRVIEIGNVDRILGRAQTGPRRVEVAEALEDSKR